MVGEAITPRLSFFSDASVEPDRLILNSVSGHEALSKLFEYALVVHTSDEHGLVDDELNELMQRPCGVSFGSDESTRLVHGRISAIDADFDPATRRHVYTLHLVPKVWDATKHRRSRVFQEVSVVDIVTEVLSEHLSSSEFNITTRGTYATEEYVVQYHEDDWSFINRLMEHVGIFHWFTHDDDKAVLNIADHNHATTELEPTDPYHYAPNVGAVPDGHTIRRALRKRRVGTSDVRLRDYNWRTPADPVEGTATSDATLGVGMFYNYGDHVKDNDAASDRAQVRAEELAALLDVHALEGDIVALSPGHRLLLDNYPEAGGNLELLVVEAELSQETTAQSNRPIPAVCKVRCIPAETQFRPARTTPKPKIAGFIHATVDGVIDDAPAPIDDKGRYKVVVKMDMVGTTGGAASRWIRMAQPHAGPGYGMHLPLHCGAEVLLAHVDGDIDRPVIIGSVPNEEQTSPVTEANATQAVIRTRADILIEMDDDV